MLKTGPLLITFFLTILLVFIGCTDNPLEVSKENLLTNSGGEVLDTVLYAIADTSYLGKTAVATQFSTRLMTGSQNGITSRLILRFTSLPLLAEFKSIRIDFLADGFQGDSNAVPFHAKAYPVAADWNSNIDAVWDDYTQNIHMDSTLGEIDFTTTGNDSMVMNPLGIEKFTYWADSANYDRNFGLFIDVENPTFMKYMNSRNSSNYPRLFFTYTTPSDTTMRTDSLEAAWDAFHYTGLQNTIADRNYASTLSINRTLIKFDLEGLAAQYPDGIEVVSANLEVPVDNSASAIDSSYGPRLSVWKLLSEINSSAIEADSNSTRVVPLSSWDETKQYLQIPADGSRKLLARALVQPQLFGIADNLNYGFIIDTQDETPSVTSIAFYKRDVANPELRPRLKLIYNLPTSPRF